VRTFDYLTDPSLGSQFIAGLVAALAIALLCGVLSVMVVLKRLAFIGQGVSHAAFGGVGLAMIFGLATTEAGLGQELAMFFVVVAFCIASALGVAWLSREDSSRADTAIGVVLAGAMAIGFLLAAHAARRAQESGELPPPSIETVLFGSFLTLGGADALIAWGCCILILGVLWWVRRPLLFASFDEEAAISAGLPVAKLRLLLLCLLAVAIVVTMRLAGVVLASALLVLPGAVALRLSARLWLVLTIGVVVSIFGTMGGVVLAFELDWQAGPSVAVALLAIFLCAEGARAILTR